MTTPYQPAGEELRAIRSYSTRFPTVEEPIAEGGIWLNGGDAGVDWTDVLSRKGCAYGAVSRMRAAERRTEQGNFEPGREATTEPEGDYDDPTAVLAGVWGSDQRVRADVYSRNQTETLFQEVQVRLRHSMRPRHCTGYELIWRCLDSENSYVEIVRWNGPVGDFTSLARRVGAACRLKDGDRIEGTIFDDRITGFTNGIEVLSVSDRAIAGGAPGFGFNFGVGNTNVDHGITHFAAETYET